MGRVKIPPTPRAASLNDAMKAAAARIGPPTADEYASATKVTKQVSRNSLPTPRGSQDRATSEPAGKRKAASESKASSALPSKDTKLALRSSSKPALTTNTEVESVESSTLSASDGPPSKRHKVDKPSPAPRRSARSKNVNDSPAVLVKKTLRSSSRATRSSKATEEADIGAVTASAEHEDAETASQKAERLEATSATERSSTGDPAADVDVLPSPESGTIDLPSVPTDGDRRDSGPPVRETMSLPPPNALIGDDMSPDTLDPALGGKALPTSFDVAPTGITEEQILSMPGQQAHYGIPPPGSWIQTPNGMVQIGADGAPMIAPNGSVHPQGYLTSNPNAVGANGQPLQYLPNRRGQKVKGRPTPKKVSSTNGTPGSHSAKSPDINTDNADANNRALANTYPRKQPFKAQIEFPGYPPPNTEIPANYTMWEICQLMPNSLRENNLRAFVQREWSANELCACLKDDARAILNARPGKDKTMVFQKRMERIKKDLIAKGEYDALLRSPPLREDGRPTWVKRGNVRRK